MSSSEDDVEIREKSPERPKQQQKTAQSTSAVGVCSSAGKPLHIRKRKKQTTTENEEEDNTESAETEKRTMLLPPRRRRRSGPHQNGNLWKFLAN